MSSISADAQVVQEGETDENKAVAIERTPDLVRAAGKRDLEKYENSIQPLLERSCFDCHSGDTVEGNFRADRLDPDMVNGEDFEWWMEVYSVLSKGEMPPADSSELSDDERVEIVNWLSTEMQAAENFRKSSGHHTSFRRLTRYEYNYALQDLLGVPWEFAGDLPAESSENAAFENNAQSLHMSVKQVEAYHQLALKALGRITVRGDRPPTVHWAIPMKIAFQREKKKLDRDIESARRKLEDTPEGLAAEVQRLTKRFQADADTSHYLDLSTGLRAEMDWNYRKASYAFKHSDTPAVAPDPGAEVAVLLPGRREELTVELGDRLPDAGTMRVRIRASRAKNAGDRVPSLQLHFGFRATDQGGSNKRLSRQDVPILAPFGKPEFYQWEIPISEIEHRNTYRGEYKLGDQPNPSEFIRFANSTIERDEKKRETQAILIDYVEVAAPVYDQWPPKTHRGVFIESVNSIDESVYAREIISDFMTRAWRRAPSSRDVDRKLELFHRLRPHNVDFQQAIIEVLATVLSSPKFLYVLPGDPKTTQINSGDRLSQSELATRLSLFLWCSLPDKTLLNLASEGRLDDAEVLRQQTERMLADPRATRFTKHFVQQWLKMQPLEFLSPSRGDDGIDAALLESSKQEPIELIADMIRSDSSVLELVDSDYLVINERLAKHYGIPAVQGNHFRRVALPSDSRRGGLLTQAGLLAMNSDGEDSHPVKRGVWLLTNLLNDPPPPPPPAVPEIDLSDPAIAKMTLKERIEDHRNHAACLSCHEKIDPWGIAFENFDALGRWRDQIDGKLVDSTSMLPSNARLDGMKGLKEHLIQNRQDQFVRATVEKMASYALGRQLKFGDRKSVDDITRQVRASGDGLGSMVMCLVTSDLFWSK